MSEWVKFHREICTGAKRGMPRAVRFVYMELSLESRPKLGVIVLPMGMSDIDGLHDAIGGNRKEIVEAVKLLSSGDEPMIRFEDTPDGRACLVTKWEKWNSFDRTAAERQREHRRRLSKTEAVDSRDAVNVDSDIVAGHAPVTRDMGSDGNVTSLVTDARVTEPRARALISSPSLSDSVSDLERDPGGLLGASPAPVATASGRLPDGIVNFEREAWVSAYERAVTQVVGDVWTFPRKQISAMRSVVEAHCLGDFRRDIQAWIAGDVAAFVTAVRSFDPRAGVWSGFGPDGWLKWHNEQCPGKAAAVRPRKLLVSEKTEKATPEQLKAICAPFNDQLARLDASLGTRASPAAKEASPVNVVPAKPKSGLSAEESRRRADEAIAAMRAQELVWEQEKAKASGA